MDKDEKLAEFNVLRDEMSQRSRRQHQYMLLNIAIAGSILSFSISQNDTEESTKALLIIPIFSFSLFMLWYSEAISIAKIGYYIHDLMPNSWEQEKTIYLKKLGRLLQIFSYGVGHMTHYVGAPFISLFLFQIKDQIKTSAEKFIFIVDIILLSLIFFGIIFWFYEFRQKQKYFLFTKSFNKKNNTNKRN